MTQKGRVAPTLQRTSPAHTEQSIENRMSSAQRSLILNIILLISKQTNRVTYYQVHSHGSSPSEGVIVGGIGNFTTMYIGVLYDLDLLATGRGP